MRFSCICDLTLLFHYEFYAERVEDPDLKAGMAGRYQGAAQTAREQGVYSPAFSWFRKGKALFSGDISEADYDLALIFSNSAAETAFLLGRFDTAKAICDDINARAACYRDKVAAELVLLSRLKSLGEMKKTQLKGIDILANTGERPDDAPMVEQDWYRFRFLEAFYAGDIRKAHR